MPEPVARRLHPLSPFVGRVSIDPRFAVTVGALVVSGRRAWLGAAAVLLLLGWRIVGWWRTSYELDHERLVVSSGVLNRTVRIVVSDRVQQIEVVRRLRHRLLGLATLRIEPADGGPGDRAIVLEAVSLREGQRVRALLERARRVPDAVAEPSAAAVLQRVSNRQLAIGGLTGAPLLLVPVAGFTVVEELDGIGDGFDLDGLAGAAVFGFVLLALLGWVVVAAGQMVVRHAGLVLTRDGDEIQVVRGLLERRTSVIPWRRVQLVEVSATFVRRACRLATIDVRTAGQLELEGTGSLDNTVPIIASDDAASLVRAFLGDVTPPPADRPHPAAARWASVLRRLPFAAAASGAAALAGGRVAGVATASLGLAVVGLGALWRHRSLAHGCDNGVIVVRAGVVDRAIRYAPIDKVQSVVVRQGPLQRGLGIFTATVQLAGGSRVTIGDVSAAQVGRIFRDTFGVAPPEHRRILLGG